MFKRPFSIHYPNMYLNASTRCSESSAVTFKLLSPLTVILYIWKRPSKNPQSFLRQSTCNINELVKWNNDTKARDSKSLGSIFYFGAMLKVFIKAKQTRNQREWLSPNNHSVHGKKATFKLYRCI